LQQEYNLRRRFGDAPSIAEYQQRFPHLQLTGDTLASDASFDTDFGAGSESEDPARRAEVVLKELGDYELLEELGRGGMGVVFRALQRSTDRVVALKVIRLDRLESLPPESHSSLVERFRHEVQAAARLEHENIITVYEVGHVADHQYYAMQFVDGRSLAEILHDGPLPHRKAAEYVTGIARAVQVAHEAGVLHRDLKPQNIMVDTKTDRALVADFGLAKLTTGSDQLTRAGDVVGTPSYMAPEQAKDAANVTPSADIYGLGATLYHLLCGRPPFQAARPVETLRQAMDEDPVSPSQLNPSIDRDLETICLKCLQKEPSRRYATAALLADDLSSYLQGEPIQARPVGALERGFRWCRRNPVTAASIAAAVGCLVLLLLVAAGGYIATSAALAESRKSDRQTRIALGKAEESYRMARTTVDGFYTQVSETELFNVPGMQPIRRDLLERALRHYQQFLAKRGEDDGLRKEMGLAYYRVASITEEIDSAEAALPSYKEAQKVQEQLVAEAPEDTDAQQALGTTLNALGRALRELERLDEAAAMLQEAKKVRSRLLQQQPSDSETKRTLANTLMNIGVVEKAQGHLDAAQGSMQEAQRLRQKLVQTQPNHAAIRRDLGMGYYNLGTLAMAGGDFKAAAAELDQAIGQFEIARKLAPGDQSNSAKLALCYRVLGHLKLRTAGSVAKAGSDEEAQEARNDALLQYENAIHIVRGLAERNPDVVDYQRDLAAIFIETGYLQFGQGRLDRASETYDAARKILEPLADKDPDLRCDLAVTLRQLAAICTSEGRTEEAEQNLNLARQHLEMLTSRHPDNKRFRNDLSAVIALLERPEQ
jgi:tetratricopeptide (TPR) repeat protein/predicted Ser/Thr protein kinase